MTFNIKFKITSEELSSNKLKISVYYDHANSTGNELWNGDDPYDWESGTSIQSVFYNIPLNFKTSLVKDVFAFINHSRDYLPGNQYYSTEQQPYGLKVIENGAKLGSRVQSHPGSYFYQRPVAGSSNTFAARFNLALGTEPSDSDWFVGYITDTSFAPGWNGGQPLLNYDETPATVGNYAGIYPVFWPRTADNGNESGTGLHKIVEYRVVLNDGVSMPTNLSEIFYWMRPPSMDNEDSDSQSTTEADATFFLSSNTPSYYFSFRSGNSGAYSESGTFFVSGYDMAAGAPAAATPEMKFGYYPLYQLEADSDAHAGGDGTSHSHVLDGVTYYMPNGLAGGIGGGNQFHGTYGQLAQYDLDSDATDSVGSNDGTANNLTFETSGGRTYADLNGSSSEILLDQSVGDYWASDASWSMWFKTTATAPSEGDFLYMVRESYSSSSQSYLVVAVQPAGNVTVALRNKAGGWATNPTWAGTTVNDGQWHMATFVREGTSLHLYVDGSLEGSLTNISGTFLSNVPVRIGSYSAGSSSPSKWFDGQIDDMRMWDRALGADEVAYWYAETTVSEEAEEAQSSESSYDWTHGGQLTNIVKFVQGQDLGGNRSYAYAKKEDDGSTTLYFTPDLTNFAAFNSYDYGTSSIDGAPVFIEYGAGGKVAVGTDTGKVYLIELDGYSVPQGCTLLHDVVGGHPVNSLKYGYAMNVWIFEAGGDIYTIPAAGGGAVMRHTLPAGAKVVDFAEGDDGKVAFIVRLADFSLEPRVTPADWSVVYGPSSMVADAAVATDFNYSHAMDLWVSSNADGSAFTSVGDLLDFLS